MMLLKPDMGRRYTALLILSTLTAILIGERACGRRYYPAAAFMSASDARACFGRYPSWATRKSLFTCRTRSRVMLETMMSNEFNERVITGRLEKNYKVRRCTQKQYLLLQCIKHDQSQAISLQHSTSPFFNVTCVVSKGSNISMPF